MNQIFTRKSTLFLSGALFIFSACGSNDRAGQVADATTPIAVHVAKASGGGAQQLSISGQIEASQTANISTRIMGYITSLKVDVGDKVSKGQVLGSISNQDILAKRAQVDAQIAAASASVASAQKDYDRFTALYKQQSATAKELDNVTLQYQATKAQLQGAQQMRNEVNAMLGYSTLVAPFSGTVTQKLAEAGSMASPGMPILTIEQTGNYQVKAAVPESSIGQVKAGATATVHVASAGKTFDGKITEVNPSSQFTGGQYIIKVSVPAEARAGLYAGMYATVQLQGEAKPQQAKDSAATILVPLSSIYYKDQLTGVFTISSSNTALLRWIRLGKIFGDQVEVLSGLDRSETIITSADGKLYNGLPIKKQGS